MEIILGTSLGENLVVDEWRAAWPKWCTGGFGDCLLSRLGVRVWEKT